MTKAVARAQRWKQMMENRRNQTVAHARVLQWHLPNALAAQSFAITQAE
jgi:hypothetical protein